MRRTSRGIAHVVQAIEKCDEVVVVPRIVLGLRDFKSNAVADTGFLRALPRGLDRLIVIVEADEFRLRVGLCHQDGRGAEAETDVSHFATALQSGVDAFQRRNPRRNQIRRIARAEKSFGADEQLMMMLVPAHALPGLEALGELLFRSSRCESALKR